MSHSCVLLSMSSCFSDSLSCINNDLARPSLLSNKLINIHILFSYFPISAANVIKPFLPNFWFVYSHTYVHRPSFLHTNVFIAIFTYDVWPTRPLPSAVLRNGQHSYILPTTSFSLRFCLFVQFLLWRITTPHGTIWNSFNNKFIRAKNSNEINEKTIFISLDLCKRSTQNHTIHTPHTYTSTYTYMVHI